MTKDLYHPKPCIDVLRELGVPNAERVEDILRRKCDERGINMDKVHVEDSISVLDDGTVRFALGGTGSLHIDPKALRVLH
jgi:hypothetical protein